MWFDIYLLIHIFILAYLPSPFWPKVLLYGGGFGLGKHTDPIPNILSKLVKYNPRAEDDEEDYIFPDELNKLVRFVGKTEGVNITGLNDKGLIKNNVLLGAIRREFNLDADYKTKAKGFTNKSTNKTEYVRVYPNLCKTDKYEEYLKQMKDEANQ